MINSYCKHRKADDHNKPLKLSVCHAARYVFVMMRLLNAVNHILKQYKGIRIRINFEEERKLR
jgi:hypothetical protein